MADVFLSYSREDRERVRPLQSRLAERGLDIFWDTEILPGHRWDEELQHKLEFAKCVLVAWSANSVRSHWVKDEASYGRDRKMLLPVTIDGTEPPLGFRQIQTVDLSHWSGSADDPAFEEVLRQAQRLVGRELPASSEAAGPSMPRNKRRAGLVAGAAAFVIVVLAAALWAFVAPVRTSVSALLGGAATPLAERAAPAVAEARSLPEPGTRIKECLDCPTMVVIPAGQSLVGAPADAVGAGEAPANQTPQHRIVIAQPFAVSEREVTLGEFQRFVEASGYAIDPGCTVFSGGFIWDKYASFERPGYAQDAEFPAVCVSFEDAEAYAAWLSDQTGARYRLPSEAEWEYAARAGSAAAYPFGDTPKAFCNFANLADVSAAKLHPGWSVADCDDGHAGAAATGSFAPNAFGVADMLGNVWEWVADCWHDTYELAPVDGSAWTESGDCQRRVVRGGSWDVGPRDMRVSLRGNLAADARHAFYGFRVARSD